MDRLFLDANVLFSASYREASRLAEFWNLSDVELVTSAYAIEEARRNLPAEDQRMRLDQLVAGVVIVSTSARSLPADLLLPEKDLPILSVAIGSGATHLITGDKSHFGNYFEQLVGGVLIQAPSSYLDGHAKKS
ncbi:MAG: PIN domain-containing protein [Pirellulales bacterium]